MGLEQVTSGQHIPNDINVIIEIPLSSYPVKYEIDEKIGVITVDRYIATRMSYPCNYGFIPRTLSEDGDPLDVLVISPYPFFPGVVIRCRPIGLLHMTDEDGPDAKILALPINKIDHSSAHIEKFEDVDPQFLAVITHFFQHYKDLEPGKWVKVGHWDGPPAAKAEIQSCVERYQKSLKLDSHRRSHHRL